MVDGAPDARRFEQVIGAALDGVNATRRRPTVWTHGEMADLLWASGQSRAALRLEELRNRLIERRSVHLLCSYSLANFQRAADRQRFELICEAHPRVGPPDGFPAEGCEPEALRQVALLQQRALAGAEAQRRNLALEAELRAHERSFGAAARELRRATEAIRHHGREGGRARIDSDIATLDRLAVRMAAATRGARA